MSLVLALAITSKLESIKTPILICVEIQVQFTHLL
jgi:hypothetical protein